MIDHYVDDKTPGTSFPDTIRTNPIVLVSWIIFNHLIKLFLKELKSLDLGLFRHELFSFWCL